MTGYLRQPSCRNWQPAGSKNRYIIEFAGYSMVPALRPGDRLVVNDLPAKAVEVGDILVTRRNEHPPAAHRLVKRLAGSRGFTKGDAMPAKNLEPVILTGSAERVEAVIRGKRIISLSSGFRGATKRWQAFLSRRGWTAGSIRQRVRTALFGRPVDHRLPAPRRSDIARWLVEPRDRRIDLQYWQLRVPILLSEGMAGIAYRRLRRQPVGAADCRCLASAYHATVRQNLVHLHFIERLEKKLVDTRIEVMITKGGALLDHVYPHVGSRPMEDLDLIVRPADRRQLVKLLMDMGFRQNPMRDYSLSNNRMQLDVHSHALNTGRILSRSRLLPAGMAPFWRKAVPWDDGYRRVWRPDDADHILILCQHLLKHYYCRLIWFEDIRRLLVDRDDRFIRQLCDRTAELGQEKPLAYCLYLLRRLFGFSLPQTSVLRERCQPISAVERLLLSLPLVSQQVELLAPVLMACCIGDFRHRVAFLWESLFLRSEVLTAEFGHGRCDKMIGGHFSRVHRAGQLFWCHLASIAASMWNRRCKPPMRSNGTDTEIL